LAGLKANGVAGFATRATHNLWTLLEEARLIELHLISGDYQTWFDSHIDNSIYRPLIEYLLRAPDPATPR
jgi:hypothetical protein